MELERERERPPKLQEGQKLKKNNDELTSNVHKIIEINQRKEISHEKIQQRFSKLRTKRLRRNGKCLVVRSEEILANRENQYVSAEGEYERLNMNGIFHLDVKELQKIIRQSSKERLQLERHLARATEAVQKTADVDINKYVALEQTNQSLRFRLEELESLVSQHRDALTEECHQLRKSLDEARCNYKTAQCDVLTLQEKVNNLESLVKHMREAAEKRKELERQHAEALEELDKRQEEIRVLGQSKNSEKQHLVEVIKSLESKVRELQKKCELQNDIHEELVLEMAALRRSQSRRTWSTQRSHSADIPHDQDSHSSEEVDRMLASTGMLMSTTYGQYSGPPLSLSSVPSSSLPYLDQINLFSHTSGPWTNSSPLTYSTSKDVITAPLKVKPTVFDKLSFTTLPLTTPATLDSASKEIDRILQRIEQDNRLLAELDKTKGAFSSSVPGSPIFSESAKRLRAEGDTKLKEELTYLTSRLKPSFSSPAIDQLLVEPQSYKQVNVQLARYRGVRRSSVTRKELDLLMAKLEQDNKILSELDRKRVGGLSMPSSAPTHLPAVSSLYGGGLASFPIGLASSTLPTVSVVHSVLATRPTTVPSSMFLVTGPPVTTTYSLTTEVSTFTAPQTTVVPVTVAAVSDQNDSGVATSVEVTETGDGLEESSIDHIELPGRGRCKVYIARYTYDPLQQSPNENPESELSLNAGDYVLIFGEMDEDGFFNGELLDGRKGLVPSNFVEMLCGEELFDFQTSVLYGNRDSDGSSASFTIAGDYDVAGFSGTEEINSLPSDDYHRMNDYIDLEDIEEVDEDDLSDAERETEGPVPPPQRLILERQLNKSILIGWLPPEGSTGNIQMYHVYVDGVLKATTQSSERTRALVEGVDSSQPHRISVRSVTSSGHHSRDAACTITVGKDIPLAPSCVKASNVTSTSAVISWLPSNSNFTHAIAVNNVEIRVVKPAIFRHTITGLAPNTLYRVSVRAKPGKLLYNAEKNLNKLAMLSTFVDFRTLPKGLPDPPVDVQIEAGPQDGTLLVTWLPVTINPNGTSNGAPVTGYAVFAGGKKITEIDSPTGDHALLEIKDLFPIDKKTVTVRTKSGDNLSSDSMPCSIPDVFIGTSTQKDRAEEETSHSEFSDIVEGREGGPEREHPHRRDRVRDSRTEDTTTVSRDQSGPRHLADGDPDHQQTFHSPPSGHKYMSRPHDRRVDHLIQERRNSAGQLIIEPDESLSDKEIYPSDMHMPIPSIEVTKDSASEGCNSVENFSEEEYEAMRRVHRSQPKGYPELSKSRGGQQVYSADRSGPRPVSPTPSRVRHFPREEGYCHYRDVSPVSHRRDNNYPVDTYRGSVDYRGQPLMDVNHPDNRVRWFVALFDYNPHTMSPNPDAGEELPFQEGQLIKIYGEKDPDGFYRGEINGRAGFVPCNMVSEVQLDDEEIAQQLANENISPRSHLSPVDRDIDTVGGVQLRKMVALYDYDPQELSPNVDAEMELTFNTGDIIYVYGDMDEDGFYMGEINGIRGLVPSNFLTEAPPDYKDNRSTTRGQLGPPGVGNVSQPKASQEQPSQYPRGTSSSAYHSTGSGKDHIPPSDRGRYISDREAYDRGPERPSHPTSRSRYSSERVTQLW
ncbi:RIMS-binding protein 2-like isoform X4 [Tachypleus tridentatus]|uniref:RIMS-binding protein 2-like isoform X4 n=1 Tax=Tachypleus tridentatus TaxID=6853 RepID=UPI003FD3B791